MYTSRSTPFRQELIIVRTIIFLFLFFPATNSPAPISGATSSPATNSPAPISGASNSPATTGTVYAHIKAVVTFAPGANVTEILQQFILNATRGFCDDDCQIDATVTPAADETPPPS
ncbi:uncharacterized protein ACBT44_019452 isoform 7-T7 [Syngnathus typhle]